MLRFDENVPQTDEEKYGFRIDKKTNKFIITEHHVELNQNSDPEGKLNEIYGFTTLLPFASPQSLIGTFFRNLLQSLVYIIVIASFSRPSSNDSAGFGVILVKNLYFKNSFHIYCVAAQVFVFSFYI